MTTFTQSETNDNLIEKVPYQELWQVSDQTAQNLRADLISEFSP